MSLSLNQICVSNIVDGRVHFFGLDYYKQNMDLDTLFTHISLPKNPKDAIELVNKTHETANYAEICGRLMVLTVPEETNVISVFAGGVGELNEFCKNKLNSKVALLHLNEKGEWQFAAKSEELDTNGLISLEDALQQLYSNQNIPDDLIETLFASKDHPLRIFETEEYADDEKVVYKIEPLFSDCPAHITYEDNYVTELEFEED